MSGPQISQTYEQTTANTKLQQSPDPIHWDPSYSFRSKPYRHLHHQNGKIGTFTVRLVEAKDLRRHHWSVLGMGVVKHLGLSNAHGDVSSFASMKVGYRFREDAISDGSGTGSGADRHHEYTTSNCTHPYGNQGRYSHDAASQNWQQGNIAQSAAVASSSVPSSNNDITKSSRCQDKSYIIYTDHSTFNSTTIDSNSNPKWPTVQTQTNTSTFHIPLKKGNMPQDGMEIILSIQMIEKRSAVDSLVPIGKGGGNGLLGSGEINLTRLVMRGLIFSSSRNSSGHSNTASSYDGKEDDVVDVLDEWIYLSYDSNDNEKSKSAESTKNENDNYHGKVRLLISYEPHGLTPQQGDIVAFEAFARRPLELSRCPTIVQPLYPLQVKEIKGEFLLVKYEMLSNAASYHNQISAQLKTHEDYLIRKRDSSLSSSTQQKSNNKVNVSKRFGALRIHRNTIFVIERTNLVDVAVDISLKPTDILLSTSVGQSVSHAAQPYVEAAGDILAPALLSSRLLLEAGKLGGGALAVGVKSAVVSVMANSDPEKRRKAKRHSFDNEE
mmetsp:Transcript_477/g.671  ORF Transcript_477/g.671 Transcript_477/m.671 type:complete len:552 (-) Transcript_477:21-1676(-)